MSTNNEAIIGGLLADQLREWAKRLSDLRDTRTINGSGELAHVVQGMKEVADNLAEQSVREKWDVAVKSLTDQLVRLDLEVLVADSIEDYCLTDGYYQIMLRYDQLEPLRGKLLDLATADEVREVLFEEDE